MKARKKIIIVTIAACFVLNFAPTAWSKPDLPDLTVTNIRKVQGCKIEVTIANIGKGKLSPISYDTGSGGVWISMYNGRKPWGSMVLGAFDRNKTLMNPHGKLSFIWKPGRINCDKLPPGTNYLKVTIDTENNVTESNESNNTLKKTIVCPFIHKPIPVTTGKGKAGKVPSKKPRLVLPREKVEGFTTKQPLMPQKNIPKEQQKVK